MGSEMGQIWVISGSRSSKSGIWELPFSCSQDLRSSDSGSQTLRSRDLGSKLGYIWVPGTESEPIGLAYVQICALNAHIPIQTLSDPVQKGSDLGQIWVNLGVQILEMLAF